MSTEPTGDSKSNPSTILTLNPTTGSIHNQILVKAAIAVGICLLTLFTWFFQDTLGSKARAVVGIFCFIGLAFCFSKDIFAINRRIVITGIGLQFLIAISFLKIPDLYHLFSKIGDLAREFLEFSNVGAQFVFGPLSGTAPVIFVFRVLPAVIFVSSFFTVLYYVGILPRIVSLFARIMLLIMGRKGLSGAETLSGVASVFMGQTEAPLIVKPFIGKMTQSELLTIMICGMAHISGGLIAAYIEMGADPISILTTSIMALPAALYVSKILLPETGEPITRGSLNVNQEKTHANIIDAASSGASEGMKLVINITAMLIAFLAIMAMCNALLQKISPGLSLQSIFSQIFAPVALLMGVASDEIPKVANLLGNKLVLNEFIAYKELTTTYRDMDPRSFKLTTFALTGFANFGSIGIQIGGIGAMAPERRGELAKLGTLALFGGFLATLINASIAGILLE